MNRHPFRWESLAFGLLFLAVVATWAAWKSGLLERDQLAYAPAATLIVLGVAGVIATLTKPRRAAVTNETEEVPDDEVDQAGPQW
jgi:uncharacterized membrane protein YqjE